MAALSTGRALLSLTSFWSAYGCYHFDWNETHIYNPEWPAHAKFHNAQTMSTGAVLGAAGLYLLWGRRSAWTRERLQVSTAAASMYWVTQLSAALYPGTALFDHACQSPFHKPHDADADADEATGTAEGRNAERAKPPRFRGPQTIVAGSALALNILGYALEYRRLKRLTT